MNEPYDTIFNSFLLINVLFIITMEIVFKENPRKSKIFSNIGLIYYILIPFQIIIGVSVFTMKEAPMWLSILGALGFMGFIPILLFGLYFHFRGKNLKTKNDQ